MSAPKRITAVLILLVLAGLALLWYEFVGQRESGLTPTAPAALSEKSLDDPGVLAKNLEIPWSLDFLRIPVKMGQ